MARSVRKGPFIDEGLEAKVEAANKSGDRKMIRTWSRRSTVTPDFVGQTFAVHNGRKFVTVLFADMGAFWMWTVSLNDEAAYSVPSCTWKSKLS